MVSRLLRLGCTILVVALGLVTSVFAATALPASVDTVDQVLIPSAGATESGSAILDAEASDTPGVTEVVFELSGASLSNQVVATGTSTIYGWLASWNTTTVANGAYSLVSVATDADGNTDTSTPVSVSVDNAPPSTSMLVPTGPNQGLEGGVAQSGDELLDASASPGVTSVGFTIYGGPDHAVQTSIAAATPTIYGWLAHWNSEILPNGNPLPNGNYLLASVASYSGGVSGTSAPVSITVDNVAPATTVIIPRNNADVSGTTSVLDALAPSGVTNVSFELNGGPSNLSNQLIGTGTLSYYGWLAEWNTTSVSDGSYTLETVATYAGGESITSAPLTIMVDN
jgi:hypothetical protein